MGFVLMIVLILCFTVFPVMVGAKMVKAEKTGFGSAFLAVIALTILSVALNAFIFNQLLSSVISALLGAMVLAGILGTTFWRGMAVSIIVVIIQLIVALVFASSMFGTMAVTA